MPDFETPLDRFWQSTLCCCECPALGPWQKFAPEARGNPQCGLVILGEAPGRVSLEQGRPFSNPRNLTVRNAVARAIAPWKIDPERFMYFTDAVKCWPSTASGANRSPSARENANCIKLHLHRELKIIQPRAIFAFGLRATSALLGGPVKLTDHHATIHEHPGGYRVIRLMHPSSINIAGMYRVGLQSQADYETQLAEIFRTEIGRLEIDFARLIYDWESGLEAQ